MVLAGAIRSAGHSARGGLKMDRRLVIAITLGLLGSSQALAAEINILSAGAIEPGLVAAADVFRKESSIEVKIKYATAPAIQQRVGGGEVADVVIAPPAVIDELAKAGKLDAESRVTVGKVGVGIIVRNGAAKPDVSSTDALKRALLDADSVVYNKASSGLYLEKLFERLGAGDNVKAKETRYADGAAVLEHVIKGKGKEIGFGALPEISLYRDKGLQLVGPLPGDVQNYTTYAAALPAAAPPGGNRDGATAFVRFLGTPAAKAAFTAKGIE
jgi:molybdate transport system substrate-binding protein